MLAVLSQNGRDQLKSKQSLYILAFKDDGLIKVGVSGNPRSRSAALGSAYFDLSAPLWTALAAPTTPY